MRTAIGRRELLRAALACGCLPLLGARAPQRGRAVDVVPPQVAEAARRVGERCRAAGVVGDEAALLDGYDGASAADLARFLSAKVRADFAADRLIAVGPWWLAESECRLFALL